MMIYPRIIKPILDVVFATLLFVFLSPLILLTSILLGIANHGSVFFVQERPGLRGKIFKIIKFKTMRDAFNSKGEYLPDEERITKIGHWVRKLSIDELPQLINVIKGDMSFIGPRPLLVEYLPLYSAEQNKRHLVKPGITGWAQVNGRNAISWEKKFELDVFYVYRISLALDIKIFILTIYKIFKAKDINQIGHVSSEKFKSSND